MNGILYTHTMKMKLKKAHGKKDMCRGDQENDAPRANINFKRVPFSSRRWIGWKNTFKHVANITLMQKLDSHFGRSKHRILFETRIFFAVVINAAQCEDILR